MMIKCKRDGKTFLKFRSNTPEEVKKVLAEKISKTDCRCFVHIGDTRLMYDPWFRVFLSWYGSGWVQIYNLKHYMFN